MSPNRILELIKPFFIILSGVFIVMLIYGAFQNDEYDDDSVTITFRCSDVLQDRKNYMEYIVQECIRLRNNET